MTCLQLLVATLLGLVHGVAAALYERGPTIEVGGRLTVTLDALLPRPLYVLLDGINFSASVNAAGSGSGESAVGRAAQRGCVSNDTVANVGCWGASDGGPAADKNVWGTGKSVPKASSAEECCALCANHSKCAAWTWNGPKGNLYCYGCELDQLAIVAAGRFSCMQRSLTMMADASTDEACMQTRATHNLGTQISGSMKKIIPAPASGPPRPPGPHPGGGGTLPPSVACIGIVAANGNVTTYCATNGETKTIYSAVKTDSAFWSATLTKPGGATVNLAGAVSVAPSIATKAVELEWTLTKAESQHVVVRAVDLGFGLVGLSHSGDTHFTTHQTKNWCPPGTGCQEWHGGLASCDNGGQCNAHSLAAQLPPPLITNTVETHRAAWVPPHPLPFAYKALLKPGRSAFTGGAVASGSHGFAGWSSQPSLPFQSLCEYSDAAHHLSGFSSGAARINTNLRCGNVLPVTLRFGFFGDLSGDGTVNQNDAVIWTRSQYPLADSIYRHGLIVKLDSDSTSYVQGEANKRWSFNETFGLVKQLSAWADNQTLVIHLVGWQGSGHDTLYPSLNKVNSNVGTPSDLYRLAKASRQYNTIISYHINTDEAYPNYTATSCSSFNVCNYSLHPVPGTDDGQRNPDFKPSIIAKQPNGSEWMWQAPTLSDPLQGGAYHISKTKDAATGERWKRLEAFLRTVPVSTTVHSDAYRDINDSWEHDERSFIAEDEEAVCGLQADARWFAAHNLSFGVEGGNGALVAVGPVPTFSGITSYYWHGGSDATANFGTWRRIISGSAQGLDNDIAGHTTRLDPKLLRNMYTKAMVASLQMTDELLHSEPCGTGCVANIRFRSGGNGSHWPYGGDTIIYQKLASGRYANGSVFLPAVLPPAPHAPKSAPCTLAPNKVRTFSPLGGDETWILPKTWVGKDIQVRVVGGATAPKVLVNGRSLLLTGMPPATPVILTI
eukprot:COSAG02_NODE_6414_length_3587_cov_2.185493_1_plen_951_part_00